MDIKKYIVKVIVLAVAAIVLIYAYWAMKQSNTVPAQNQETQAPILQEQDNAPVSNATTTETIPEESKVSGALSTEPDNKTETLIGKSAGGTGILANHYGSGSKEILFVGGIHGGYSFNTVLLAEKLANNLYSDPSLIPADIKITIIQNLNPDGSRIFMNNAGRFNSLDASAKLSIRTEGRFNANEVDLNRNFDCNWKATGVWQNKTVSGGTAAFSEPESAAIRDYVKDRKITAVVAWYSAGGGVYSSSCGKGILPETQTITDLYAKASGYPAYKNFESYQVSGDMTDWFAKNNVPAIGVLLNTSEDEEWDKNWAGIKALFGHYAK
jgi:Zinc carboxypeptidase.